MVTQEEGGNQGRNDVIKDVVMLNCRCRGRRSKLVVIARILLVCVKLSKCLGLLLMLQEALKWQ